MLMSNGLGTLTDPGLIPQLGFLIGMSCKTHEQFRTLLNGCEPSNRLEMYEAIRAYLKFEAKPLDVYIAELGQIAESKQMPLVAPDGTLQPYRVPELGAIAEIAAAQALIEESIARWRLDVFCTRCTREEHFFSGDSRQKAVEKAREAGWRCYEFHGHDGVASPKEMCPECLAKLFPTNDPEGRPKRIQVWSRIGQR